MKIAAIFKPRSSGKISASIAYLDSLPDDEVIGVQELASAVRSTANYVRNVIAVHPEMLNRSTVASNGSVVLGTSKRRLFGNPKAIKALNDQLAKRS